MNFLDRYQKVWAQIKDHCDVLLVEDSINLYYLTGMNLSLGKLLIRKDKVTLIVDNRYFEMCKDLENLEVLPLEKTEFIDLFQSNETLAFDEESTTYQSFLLLQKKLQPKAVVLIPLKNPVANVRAVKDPEELTLLKEAAALCYKGYEFARSLLKNGITEIEVANELEIFWKKRGSQGLSFDAIIAFDTNGSMPHYRAGETPLGSNQTVLMDIGVKKNGYHSDMTRTFFWGTPSAKVQEIYTIVEEAKDKALALCKPGATVGEVDDAARLYITSKGYGEQFLHSLGHGIGLEVHEYPLIRNKEPWSSIVLEEGMVVTIEPGIYLPSIGGVRLEDTIIITASGYEIITK